MVLVVFITNSKLTLPVLPSSVLDDVMETDVGSVGDAVGDIVGDWVGVFVGLLVGEIVGDCVGFVFGVLVGTGDGCPVGEAVG